MPAAYYADPQHGNIGPVAYMPKNLDPTGTVDSSRAIQVEINAMPGGIGFIMLPPGSYLLTSGLTFNQDQGLVCPGGASSTYLYYTGSGTAITIANAGNFTGGTYAGRFQGFYLDGYGAGGSAVGIQVQDLQGLYMEDVAVYGFGGKGIYYLHGSGYAEQSNVQARVVQCGTYGTATSGAVVFDGTSFDYGNYDFTIVSSAGTHGLLMQNGAQLRGARLRMRGNFYARASANTGSVIGLDLNNASNASYITDADFDVAVESAGSAGQVGHTFVTLNSTSSSSQLTGAGVLSFNPFGPNTIYSQGFSNANFVPFGVSGYIQDGLAVGPPGGPGDALMIKGGTLVYPNGTLASRPGGGVDVYWQFGNIAEGQLGNGNNSLVFHGTTGGNVVRHCRLFLAQPASGAAGTVTWPSVKWPGGTPPTLSSTNGFVDQVDLVFLPDTNAWYGTLLGTHYS